MNPWEVFGWAAALSLAAVVTAVAVLAVASVIAELRKLGRKEREVFRGRQQ